MKNSPRETAVDIVLDVSEHFHGNVYSEVLSKVVATNIGFINSSRFWEHRRGFQRWSTKVVVQH